MTKHKSRWFKVGLATAVLAGSLQTSQAADQERQERQAPRQNQQRPTQQQVRPNQNQGNPNRGNEPRVNPGTGIQNRNANPGQTIPDRSIQQRMEPNRPDQRRIESPQNNNPRVEPRGNVNTRNDRPKVETPRTETGGRNQGVRSAPATTPSAPLPKLNEVRYGNEIRRVAPSGKPREISVENPKTGVRETKQFTPTGRVARQEVAQKDGTREIKELDLGNREKRVIVQRPDNRTETTDVRYNRFGKERARETVATDARGTVVSKSVVARQNLVIKNTTIINVNRTVVRDYRPCRWGYVYHPVYIAPVVFAAWYDPFWYGPVHHHFTYSWGWYGDPWYRRHAYYWEPYPVYYGPSYWVTDWMVAGYVADQYAVATSIEQTREEVRLAREEAAQARAVAEKAQDQAEIAEAKASQAQAEARAERAEARIAKAELAEAKAKELDGKPNPNATPISKEVKESLKNQVEKSIAEKKALSEEAAKGKTPMAPDIFKSLADPEHIYPVSKNLSVIRAEDKKPAGTLTAGDLLKLEPGQSNLNAATANENTFITMRVMTSKGEDDSIPAGTLVSIPLSELQEFDNEFQAKLDLGLAEAEKNKDEFKKNADKK
jgi:hypothetical protein